MFIRHRTDKKSGIQEGWPDITVCHVGRCLMLELKMPKGRVSPKQQFVIDSLRQHGNPVTIARSVEEAVSAVQTWLGVENAVIAEAASVPEPIRTPDEGKNLFIGRIGDQQYVFEGSGKPGTPAKMIRTATLFDLRNIKEAGR